MAYNIDDYNDIRDTLRGDHSAYERIVRRYQGQISRFMWHFTRDKQQVQALVQDVFVQAWLGLDKYRGKGPFISWLTTIAARVGYRFWKQGKDRTANLGDSLKHIQARDTGRLSPPAAAEILHNLLGHLKPAQRMVLTLMYLEELSASQVADLTGSSEAAVKMRAFRARRKLQKIATEQNLMQKLGW